MESDATVNITNHPPSMPRLQYAQKVHENRMRWKVIETQTGSSKTSASEFHKRILSRLRMSSLDQLLWHKKERGFRFDRTGLPLQPVDATQALNRSASGISGMVSTQGIRISSGFSIFYEFPTDGCGRDRRPFPLHENGTLRSLETRMRLSKRHLQTVDFPGVMGGHAPHNSGNSVRCGVRRT